MRFERTRSQMIINLINNKGDIKDRSSYFYGGSIHDRMSSHGLMIPPTHFEGVDQLILRLNSTTYIVPIDKESRGVSG